MTAPVAHDRIELDDTTAAWRTTYLEAQRQIKHYEELRDLARQHLEAALGDAEEGVHDGRVIVRFTRVHSSRIDTRKLAEQFPDVADALRVPVESRRFTVPTDDQL